MAKNLKPISWPAMNHSLSTTSLNLMFSNLREKSEFGYFDL
jgi:hypothetical protein